MSKFVFRILIIITFSFSSSYAQQNYSYNSICNISDKTGPSPDFLYTCNQTTPSCKSFLMFRTQSPYLSVSSISNLTSSDPSELARINNISVSSVFPSGKDVIIPVTCSCSGQYYQANTTYVCTSVDIYFTIAKDTYQSLTTCNALMRENLYSEFDLYEGLELKVPLRCACPSQKQIGNGTKFMFTYLVTRNDTVTKISERFSVNPTSVAIANGFSDLVPVLYPYTTLLIPLSKEPLTSQMRSFNQSVPPRKHKRLFYKEIYAGIGTGAALAILCFVLFLGFLYYYKKRKNEACSKIKGLKMQYPKNFLDEVVLLGEVLKIYTYNEVEVATDNFSQRKRVSNSVYRGVLRGKLSVIKKVSTDVSKVIKILGKINHFNLISLYGVCEHDGVFYLVYEFCEEGSLKKWLQNTNSPHAQSWSHRVLIALDIANGLDYLHNFTSPAYVHKDINSSNILLNRDLRAKIANFSLAREDKNSHTSCVVGEKGYVAPEYIKTGKVTPKADVYAFGVILLELLTGKEAVFIRDGEEVILSESVISVINGGDEINDLIDPRLHIKNPLGYIMDHSELATRLLKLSLSCLIQEPENRFSMVEVVSALMKIQSDVHNSQSFSLG
ncbi:hypothetical protein RD792_004059 [Penstemon davidsonii]|uniref:Uncharacterized protein n=1 Tax=Penstemon davidsonii TaxID=160366 RepID=A0ABR0DHS4_9LAMI|nr:hypothetical protein RD792_004059 [Penstemon davidsonii]